MSLHLPQGGFDFDGEDGSTGPKFTAMLLDSGTLRRVRDDARVNHLDRAVREVSYQQENFHGPTTDAAPCPSGEAHRAFYNTQGGNVRGLDDMPERDHWEEAGYNLQHVSEALAYFDGRPDGREGRGQDRQPVRHVYFHVDVRDAHGSFHAPTGYRTLYREVALRHLAFIAEDGHWKARGVTKSGQTLARMSGFVIRIPMGAVPPHGPLIEGIEMLDPPVKVGDQWFTDYRVSGWLGITGTSRQDMNAITDLGKTVLWDDAGRYTVETVGDPVPWLVDTFTGTWEALASIPARVFDSAHVQVDQEGFTPQGDPTLTVTAFGRTYPGLRSWAALRDQPRPPAQPDGAWDFTPMIVLLESGGDVTVLRPGADPEVIPLEVFEIEILRTLPGVFRGFSRVGQTHHSWPPQWAFALTLDHTYAIGAFDAWRDAVKTPPVPERPAHWFWPARPAKRPGRLPVTAPRAPGGLTLADVLGPVQHDDPHPRGQGPFDLPTRAEVWNAPRNAWEDSPSALAALRRRVLYQPSDWPEDPPRSSVGGRLRVTFPPAPPPTGGLPQETALIARYKGPDPNDPGPPPLDRRARVNGQPLNWIRNGHDAEQRRGVHPYVIPVPTANTYELTIRGTLSRLLRCTRSGQKVGGGGDAS